MWVDTSCNIQHNSVTDVGIHHFEVWLMMSEVEHELLLSITKGDSKVDIWGPPHSDVNYASKDAIPRPYIRQELRIKAKNWQEVNNITDHLEQLVSLEVTLLSAQGRLNAVGGNQQPPFMVMNKAFNGWSAVCTCSLYESEYRKMWEALPEHVRDLETKPVYDGGVTHAIWSDLPEKFPPIYIPKIKYQHMTFRLDLTRPEHKEWMAYWEDIIANQYRLDLITPEIRMKIWLKFASYLKKEEVDKLGGYWLPAVLNDNVRPKFVKYAWEDKLLG